MSKRKRKHSGRRPTAGARTAPLVLVPSPAPDHTGARGAAAGRAELLIGLIATGALDERLPAIQVAISERHRQRWRVRSNQAAAQIAVGDRVRLGNIRPLYLRGATGTVTAWAGQSVVVQLDEPTGRYPTSQIRCPPLGLERLPD